MLVVRLLWGGVGGEGGVSAGEAMHVHSIHCGPEMRSVLRDLNLLGAAAIAVATTGFPLVINIGRQKLA